jgi:hypothetical protein
MSARRKLTAIDDPLFASPSPPAAAKPAPQRTAALYVELPVEQWDALARAAFELRTHKRRIVAALIAAHVDGSTEAGRDALTALLEAHRRLWD